MKRVVAKRMIITLSELGINIIALRFVGRLNSKKE